MQLRNRRTLLPLSLLAGSCLFGAIAVGSPDVGVQSQAPAAYANTIHSQFKTKGTSPSTTTTTTSTTTSTTVASTTTTTAASTTTTTVAGTACSGYQVAPGQLTQTLLNNEPQGEVFCLQAGTFSLSGSLTPRSYQQIIGAGEGKTVIDGGNATATSFLGYSTGPSNVIVQNLSIEHFTGHTSSGEAIKDGLAWTVNQVEIAYNVVGIGVGTKSLVENSWIHDNTQYGPTDGNGSTLYHNVIQHNNTGNFCAGSCVGNAGAMKYAGASNANNVINDNQFINNIGNGIWLDTVGQGNVIENNSVSGNTQSGISIECTVGVAIHSNSLANDDSTGVGKSAWSGDLEINDSQDVTVQGNLIDETGNGANAISLTAAQRTCGNSVDTSCDGNTAAHGLCNVLVGGSATASNTIKVKAATQNGFVGPWYTGPIGMNCNDWYVGSTTSASWAWQTYSMTWSQLRTAGQETSGVLTLL